MELLINCGFGFLVFDIRLIVEACRRVDCVSLAGKPKFSFSVFLFVWTV